MKTQDQSRLEWTQMMSDTISSVLEDTYYLESDPKEKLLSFYYTHFEFLANHRAFVLERFNNPLLKKLLSRELGDYRRRFLKHSSDIISEAIMKGYFRDLGIGNRTYPSLIWGQLMFLIRYWITDTSFEFEKTDELIEKSVASMFDLVGKGQYQSSMEFGKFMLQNPMKFKWQQ